MNEYKKETERHVQDKYNVESTSARDLDGCATTEATGMIPAIPLSQAQLDSYKEILPFSPDCYVDKKQSPAKKERP